MRPGIVTARVLHYHPTKGVLVVQRRKKKRAEEHHKLPGGKPLVLAVRDKKTGKLRLVIENPATAARRELREEAHTEAGRLRKLGDHTIVTKDGRTEHHIIYGANLVYGKPQKGRETAKVGYYNPTKPHKKMKLAKATKIELGLFPSRVHKR